MWVSFIQPPTQSLFETAHQLLNQGLSIIPVRGGRDTHNAKIAAVRWNEYRERFATPQEVSNWFNVQKFSGIAVVCGRLSKLIVLDFDDLQAYQRFARQFPLLTETYTITSAIRQTPHLYWRADLTTYGINVHGGELRAEGQYVVTAPTRINDSYYTIQHNIPIREITPHELYEALHFLKPQRQQSNLQSIEHTQDIIHLYRESAPAIGRNNALYQASRHAQRSGWTLTHTLEALTPIHTEQRPSWQHRSESSSERRKEAARTITSAFKHAATVPKHSTEGLPNSIREKLIKTQKTATTARLLEALYTADVKEFTEAQATRIAKAYGIGRYSVIQALSGRWAEIAAKRIFPIVIEKNMVCRETKGVKKGRPARVYRLPEYEELYTLLEVSRSNSDAIHTDDLRSGKRYRMALHRSLIERRPGEYARGWLASRVGASPRTVQRYNRALKVQTTPVYVYARFDWETADELPLTEARQRITPGRWLEDGAGKRYPALRVLAYKLLKQNTAPVYVRRLPNHYALPSPDNSLQQSAFSGQPNTDESYLAARLPNVDLSERKAIWRCLKCGTRTEHIPAHCTCHTGIPERVGQVAVAVGVRECIHCGQLCFDDKLVCAACRRKREQPLSRITFDKEGKPRFPVRFDKTPLTRDNIRTLLPDEFQRYVEIEDPQHKAWMQTPDGRRYPPIQGLAFRLLKQHGEVCLVTRNRSAEILYELGSGLLKIGATRMGKHFLRRAGLR